MRETLCMALAAVLICALIFVGSAPETTALPAGRPQALWGLLCPGLFAQGETDGDAVIFTWPVLRRLLHFLNG